MIVYELHWYHENDEEYGNYVMGIYSSREKAQDAALKIREKFPDQYGSEQWTYEVVAHHLDHGLESA